MSHPVLTRTPAEVPVDELVFQEPPQLSFEGWQPEAFNLLQRLKQEPHIGQYRNERDSGELATFIKEPFKRYRDDLVVNWVLPSRLLYETEKYVFSRLLKNDFGAGGCHHHKWLAFYRPEKKRLTDIQITHSIWPEGMDVSLFIGKRARDDFKTAKSFIRKHRVLYFQQVNERLAQEDWRFYFRTSGGLSPVYTRPLDSLPQDIDRANAVWLRRRVPREEVLSVPATEQIAFAFDTIRQVWPLYRFYFLGPDVITT